MSNADSDWADFSNSSNAGWSDFGEFESSQAFSNTSNNEHNDNLNSESTSSNSKKQENLFASNEKEQNDLFASSNLSDEQNKTQFKSENESDFSIAANQPSTSFFDVKPNGINNEEHSEKSFKVEDHHYESKEDIKTSPTKIETRAFSSNKVPLIVTKPPSFDSEDDEYVDEASGDGNDSEDDDFFKLRPLDVPAPPSTFEIDMSYKDVQDDEFDNNNSNTVDLEEQNSLKKSNEEFASFEPSSTDSVAQTSDMDNNFASFDDHKYNQHEEDLFAGASTSKTSNATADLVDPEIQMPTMNNNVIEQLESSKVDVINSNSENVESSEIEQNGFETSQSSLVSSLSDQLNEKEEKNSDFGTFVSGSEEVSSKPENSVNQVESSQKEQIKSQEIQHVTQEDHMKQEIEEDQQEHQEIQEDHQETQEHQHQEEIKEDQIDEDSSDSQHQIEHQITISNEDIVSQVDHQQENMESTIQVEKSTIESHQDEQEPSSNLMADDVEDEQLSNIKNQDEQEPSSNLMADDIEDEQPSNIIENQDGQVATSTIDNYNDSAHVTPSSSDAVHTNDSHDEFSDFETSNKPDTKFDSETPAHHQTTSESADFGDFDSGKPQDSIISDSFKPSSEDFSDFDSDKNNTTRSTENPTTDDFADFGDFESGKPNKSAPVDDFADFGDFESTKPSDNVDDFADFGDFESTKPSDNVDDFADFGDFESTKPSDNVDDFADFGDFGSTTKPNNSDSHDDFGDFPDSSAVKPSQQHVPVTNDTSGLFQGTPSDIQQRLQTQLASLNSLDFDSQKASNDHSDGPTLESIAGDLLSYKWEPKDIKKAPKPQFRGTTFESSFLQAIGKQPLPTLTLGLLSFTKRPVPGRRNSDISNGKTTPLKPVATLDASSVSAALAPSKPFEDATRSVDLTASLLPQPQVPLMPTPTAPVDIPLSPMDFSIFGAAQPNESRTENKPQVVQEDSWMSALMGSSSSMTSTTSSLNTNTSSSTSSFPSLTKPSIVPSSSSRKQENRFFVGSTAAEPTISNSSNLLTPLQPSIGPLMPIQSTTDRKNLLPDMNGEVPLRPDLFTLSNQPDILSQSKKTLNMESHLQPSLETPSNLLNSIDDHSSIASNAEETSPFEDGEELAPVIWNLIKDMPNLAFMTSPIIISRKKH